MAAKVTAPSPQIFTSDPLEQIMGRGLLDRDMSGLSYMFLNAFGDRRKMDQDAYMSGVTQSNQVAAQVAEQELRQKQQEEFLKAAIKMAELGQDASSMPALQNIIRSGGMNNGTDLNRRLIESKINANNRDPSGGGDGIQVKVEQSPNGVGFHSITGKGANAPARVEAIRQQVIDTLKNDKKLGDAQAREFLDRSNNRYGGNVPQ